MYGWIDNSRGQFFLLNTKENTLVVHDTWVELNNAAKGLGLPILTMKDSVGYWDIVKGYKKSSW